MSKMQNNKNIKVEEKDFLLEVISKIEAMKNPSKDLTNVYYMLVKRHLELVPRVFKR